MVIPETHLPILQRKGFAHVATIGPRGEPHNSPVWYEWDGEHILVTHTTYRQKYRNIKRDSRVALSIVDPDDPYTYLEIRGIVASIEADEDGRVLDALAEKYTGEKFKGRREDRVVLKIKPLRTTHMGRAKK